MTPSGFHKKTWFLCFSAMKWQNSANFGTGSKYVHSSPCLECGYLFESIIKCPPWAIACVSNKTHLGVKEATTKNTSSQITVQLCLNNRSRTNTPTLEQEVTCVEYDWKIEQLLLSWIVTVKNWHDIQRIDEVYQDSIFILNNLWLTIGS